MPLSSLTNYVSSTMSGGGAASVLLLFFIGALIVTVILIASMWKVFEKAGKPGWAAIIPIYNIWVLFEIAGQPGWYALLSFIPFVGWAIVLVLEIIAFLEIAKRFGRSGTFGFFLLFLIPIGWLILGFGDAQYQGEAKTTIAGTANPPVSADTTLESPAQPAPEPSAEPPSASEESDKPDQQPPATPGV